MQMWWMSCHKDSPNNATSPTQGLCSASRFLSLNCKKLLFYVRYQHSRNVRIFHLNWYIKVGFFIVGINQWGLEFNTWTKTGIKVRYFLSLSLNLTPQSCMQLRFMHVLLYLLLVIRNYILSNLFYGFNMLHDLNNLQYYLNSWAFRKKIWFLERRCACCWLLMKEHWSHCSTCTKNLLKAVLER